MQTAAVWGHLPPTLGRKVWNPLGWEGCASGCCGGRRSRDVRLLLKRLRSFTAQESAAAASCLGSAGPSMQCSGVVWAAERCLVGWAASFGSLPPGERNRSRNRQSILNATHTLCGMLFFHQGHPMHFLCKLNCICAYQTAATCCLAHITGFDAHKGV